MVPGHTPRHRGIYEGTVLQILRDQGPTSRTRLARITGLSPTTITKTVLPMIEAGLLSEQTDAYSGVGRPALALSPVSDAVTVVGVQIGVGKVRLGLSDAAGRVRASTSYAFDPAQPQGEVIEGIAEMVLRQLDADHGPPCIGVGVGAPGPIDQARRTNILALNLGWRDVPIADLLEQRLGVPVVVDHNVRSFALAEARYADHHADSLAYLYVRAGVGFGVAVRGEPFYGGAGTGGESYLGHLPGVENGRKCSCGASGCLETLVAEPHLFAQLDTIRDAPPGDPEPMRELHALAKAGNHAAAELESTVIEQLGAAIATIVNLFTPELVLVGGTLSALSPTSLGRLDSATRHRIFPLLRDSLRIETVDSGDNALIRGAAAIALEALHYS